MRKEQPGSCLRSLRQAHNSGRTDHSHQTLSDCECSALRPGARCLRTRDSHGSHATVVWIPEKGGNVGIRRPSKKRWNAAIRNAAVIEVFITKRDLGFLAWSDCESRIEAVPLQSNILTEAVRVLIHPIEAKGHLFVERLVKIPREPSIAKSSSDE